jgi:hypothetical protein
METCAGDKVEERGAVEKKGFAPLILRQPGKQFANRTLIIQGSEVNQVAAFTCTVVVPDVKPSVYLKRWRFFLTLRG